MAEENETPNEEQVAADAAKVADEAAKVAAAEKEAKEAKELIPKSELNAKNAENKSLRDRLRALETEKKTRDDAELSATEKLQKQVEDLSATGAKREGAVKSLVLQNKLADLKDEFGLRSTRSIGKLIDADGLQFDLDELEVAGVEAQLKALKKSDPDLFISGGTDGGAGGTARRSTAPDMNSLIRGAR